MRKFIYRNMNLGLLLWLWLFGFARSQNQVMMPPTVNWKRGEEGMMIIPRKMTVFACTAEASPMATFEWRLNGSILTNYDEGRVLAFPNGSLIFSDYIDRYDGMYQCLATNLFGTSMSPAIQVVLEKPPSASDGVTTYPDKDYPVSVGQPCKLECVKTNPTYPEYFKRWFPDKNPVQFPMTARIGVDAQGTLRFSHVEKEDAKTYVCGLTPKEAIGDAGMFYNRFIIKIDDKIIGDSEPSLAYSSGGGTIKAVLQREVFMECFFSGKPTPNISWKDSSNNFITEGNSRFRLEDFNRRLVITNVLQEDEGEFKCLGSNSLNQIEATIRVNVTSPPIRDKALSSSIKPDGTDVTLSCQTKAAIYETNDKPTWYRNAKVLISENLPDPYRYSFINGDTQLVIRNISVDGDTACFQCKVTNSEGYLFQDAYLKVIKSIKISKRPAQNIRLKGNDVIDVTVLSSGDLCCEINHRWFFKDQLMTIEDLQTPPFAYHLMANTRVFNTTDVPESIVKSRIGEYVVRVSNTHQEVNVTFTISYEDSEAIVAGVEFQLWWLAIILGILAIIIAIIILICCVKRNYPRETYQLEKTELQHNLNPKEELLDQSFQEI